MSKLWEVRFGTSRIGTYRANTAKQAIASAKATANSDCNAFRKSVSATSTDNATAREIIGYSEKGLPIFADEA